MKIKKIIKIILALIFVSSIFFTGDVEAKGKGIAKLLKIKKGKLLGKRKGKILRKTGAKLLSKRKGKLLGKKGAKLWDKGRTKFLSKRKGKFRNKKVEPIFTGEIIGEEYQRAERIIAAGAAAADVAATAGVLAAEVGAIKNSSNKQTGSSNVNSNKSLQNKQQNSNRAVVQYSKKRINELSKELDILKNQRNEFLAKGGHKEKIQKIDLRITEINKQISIYNEKLK